MDVFILHAFGFTFWHTVRGMTPQTIGRKSRRLSARAQDTGDSNADRPGGSASVCLLLGGADPAICFLNNALEISFDIDPFEAERRRHYAGISHPRAGPAVLRPSGQDARQKRQDSSHGFSTHRHHVALGGAETGGP